METNIKKIDAEISKIIDACVMIRKLSPESTIPEEHIYRPYVTIKNKVVNTYTTMEIALQQLDHAYNINPFKDDNGVVQDISEMRSNLYNLIQYYKGLVNEPYRNLSSL